MLLKLQFGLVALKPQGIHPFNKPSPWLIRPARRFKRKQYFWVAWQQHSYFVPLKRPLIAAPTGLTYSPNLQIPEMVIAIH